MQVMISVFTPSNKGESLSRISTYNINAPGNTDDPKIDSALCEQLELEYAGTKCTGTPVSSIKIRGKDVFFEDENGHSLLVNGHSLLCYSWGILCVSCNKRVCASKKLHFCKNNTEFIQLYNQKISESFDVNASEIRDIKGVLKWKSKATPEGVPPGPITVFKVLYEKNHLWVSFQQLLTDIRWGQDSRNLIGVFTNLKKRVEKVSNKGITQLLFNMQMTGNITSYQMRQELRDVINSTPELQSEIRYSVNEIHAKSGQYPHEKGGGFVVSYEQGSYTLPK